MAETTSKPIEQFKSYEEYGDDCDSILTRNENNPDAPARNVSRAAQICPRGADPESPCARAHHPNDGRASALH